ncbi:MAG: hypothetical protein JWM90_1937 [Thermoleophilia bacterium]|nr:hypothetical protein [Thermoleophilia bacterium]
MRTAPISAIPLDPIVTLSTPSADRGDRALAIAPIFTTPASVTGSAADAIAAAQQLSASKGNQSIAVVTAKEGAFLLLPMVEDFQPADMATSVDAHITTATRSMDDAFARDRLLAVVGASAVAVFEPGSAVAKVAALV